MSKKASETYQYSQSLVETLRKAFPNIAVSTIIEVVKAHKNDLDLCLSELTFITESREGQYKKKLENISGPEIKNNVLVLPALEGPQILAPLPSKSELEAKKEKKVAKLQAKQKKKMEKLAKKMNVDLHVTENTQYLNQRLDKVIAESEHDGEKIASKNQVKLLIMERMSSEQEKQKALKWAVEEIQKLRTLLQEKEKTILDLKAEAEGKKIN